jgi:hypothetical protein
MNIFGNAKQEDKIDRLELKLELATESLKVVERACKSHAEINLKHGLELESAKVFSSISNQISEVMKRLET